MSTEHEVTRTLDVTGQNCPIPVIKAKQTMDELTPGDVLEVLATDPGSVPDIDGWASSIDGVELLDQVETDVDGETVYRHYLRKVT